MNLFKLFEKFEKNPERKILLAQGFQNTSFYKSYANIDVLFKEFIELYITNETETSLHDFKINTQNGLVKLVVPPHDNNNNKKQTTEKAINFGSELRIILNNLLGLMGYEFASSVLLISLYPVLIKQTTDEIKKGKTYKEIYNTVNIIKNMYNIGGGVISEYCAKKNYNNISMNYYSLNDDVHASLDKEFEEIFSRIELRIHNNNNINFEADKNDIYQKLLNIFENTTYNHYYIKEIDSLCIELGKFKPCYDNYFIKLWEILFKETYADYYEYENIYPKFKDNIEEDKEQIVIPFINLIENYIEKLNRGQNLINQIYKYVNDIAQYFKCIYKSVISSLNDNNKVTYIKVIPQEILYEHLASIFINLLMCLAKNIVVSHETINNIGKFVKLQFIEIYNSLKLCAPRLLFYTESQSFVLHYILMTDTTLEAMVNNNQLKQTSKRKSKKNDETAKGDQ